MDFNALMQQAQKMQEDLAETEKELKEKVYNTTVGGGAIQIKMNGNFQLDEVCIEETLLDKDNKEMIEEMILMAMNDVLKQASDDKEESMAALTNGVNVPGMF